VATRTGVVPLSKDASLVILAGGRSTRMGTPKRDLRVGDQTLLEWMVRRLAPSFAETIVCGASAPKPARAVADLRNDGGPLAGIEAGLRAARTPYVYVVACDMPRATAKLGDFLLARAAGHDAAVPVTALPQPLCAAYSRGAVSKISAFLDRGGRRVTHVMESLDVVSVTEADLAKVNISKDELIDLDTRADYDAFIASFRA
jgi:molybdopterin-guanine dinucleotide biosynthesis protein A